MAGVRRADLRRPGHAMTPVPPVVVTLLTQSQCKFCDHAKATLARLGQEFSLKVTAVDIGSAQGQKLAEQGAVPFPPGVFLDGQPFSYGRLSERKLRRELTSRLDRDRAGGDTSG